MRILLILILTPILASAADWGKVSWGMSRSEVTAQYPTAVPAGDSLTVGKAGEILKVPFDATFDFENDKLVGLALRSDNSSPAVTKISSDSFCDLLIGKYGAPLHLKVGPASLDGIWRSDRSVIRFFSPSSPAGDYPAYSLFYWSISSPRYNEI